MSDDKLLKQLKETWYMYDKIDGVPDIKLPAIATMDGKKVEINTSYDGYISYKIAGSKDAPKPLPENKVLVFDKHPETPVQFDPHTVRWIPAQVKEERIEEVESNNGVLIQLKNLGFNEKKLNWMLNKVSDELSKEKEKTFNDTHNSSLEVILTDVQKLLVDILNNK